MVICLKLSIEIFINWTLGYMTSLNLTLSAPFGDSITKRTGSLKV